MNSNFFYDTVPGLLQPRPKFCCIVCMMMDIGFTEGVVCDFVKRKMTPENIANLDVDIVVAEGFLPFMTRKQINALVFDCKSMLELNDYAKLVHKRYLQREYLIFAKSLGKEPAARGIKAGNILVIYYDYLTVGAKDSVLRELTRQSTSFVEKKGTYFNLPDVTGDKTIHIKPNDFQIIVYSPTKTDVQEDLYDLPPPIGFHDMLLLSIQTTLKAIDNVFVVIVDSMTAEEGSPPLTQEWVDLLVEVYGCLDDLAVVLTIDECDLKKLGLTTSAEICTTINKSLDTNTEEKIQL